jgi:tetratricopeptide (TPR) repeat protein
MVCACASAGVTPGTPPSDAEVAALQARLGSDSTRADVIVALGEAYQLQGRQDELVTLMERAAALHPDDARFSVLLGIAYEDADRLEDALGVYRAYLEEGNDAPTRRRLAGRIRVLEREQLLRTVRQSLANEATLPAPSGTGTVAVFPFLLQAQDSTLEPLSRAIAELLVTDLSQTDRLRVLERLHVQALLDEIQLAESGLVDPATAARGGRLLGAGQIVQGSVGGTEQELQLNAAVVGVSTGQPQVQTAQGASPLSRFFDAEKALALDIYRVLGIELTPAERERVNRRPTENVRALLLFGLGLEAEDVGNYQLAADYFSQAAATDPSFGMARDRAAQAEQAADAGETSTAELWAATGSLLGDPFAAVTSMIPSLTGRDAVSELYGREGLTGQGSVVRILLREGEGNVE